MWDHDARDVNDVVLEQGRLPGHDESLLEEIKALL